MSWLRRNGSDLCVTFCVAAALGRYLVTGATQGYALMPDTGRYLDGLRWFPSPIGNLIGTIGGVGLLAALSVLSAGLLVLQAASIAERYGGRPWLAAIAAVVLPVAFWNVYATTDAIAAFAVTAGFLAGEWGRDRRLLAWYAIAVGLHAAAAPIVLALCAWRYRRERRRLALPVVAVALVTVPLLVASPYGAVLTAPDLRAIGLGLYGVAEGYWPLVLVALPLGTASRRGGALGALWGPLLAGSLGAWAVGVLNVAGSGGTYGGSRYSLPLVALAAAALGTAAHARAAVRAPVPARSRERNPL